MSDIPMKKKELQRLLGEITQKYGDERRDRLRVIDDFNDLLEGFRIWEDKKVGHSEWGDMDEMLSRWVAQHKEKKL